MNDDRGWWALVVIFCILCVSWIMFLAWLMNARVGG